jgi:hypothetical protein
VANSSVHTWQPIVDGSLPLSFLQTPKITLLYVACPWYKSIVQQPSLRHGTNGLHLNHTRSMSPYDPELQHGQASAVLPIIQRKYYNITLNLNLLYWKVITILLEMHNQEITEIKSGIYALGSKFLKLGK